MRSRNRLRVQDIMVRELITVDPSATVIAAAETMARHRIGALPVIAGDGSVLGVLTASDLVWAHARSTPSPEPTTGPEPEPEPAADREQASYWYHLGMAESRRLRWEHQDPPAGALVADIYSPGALTVEQSAAVTEAARLMSHHQVHHLVVTHHGRLVGLVSALDIVRAQCPAPRTDRLSPAA